MVFSRHEYWSGLVFPPPVNLSSLQSLHLTLRDNRVKFFTLHFLKLQIMHLKLRLNVYASYLFSAIIVLLKINILIILFFFSYNHYLVFTVQFHPGLVICFLSFILPAFLLSYFSHVWLFAMLWTVAHWAPLSMGLSKQDYRSGLPCHPPGDLPNSGTEPVFLMSLALPGKFFIIRATREAFYMWLV